MRRGIVLVVLIWACACGAQDAQRKSLESKEACRALCDQAMGFLGTGRVGDAFQALRPYWLYGGDEFTECQIRAIQQMTSMTPRYGQSIGHEFVRQELVNDALLRLTYIHKFEWRALRWTFLFYKPRDRWLLTTFSWDESIQLLFE